MTPNEKRIRERLAAMGDPFSISILASEAMDASKVCDAPLGLSELLAPPKWTEKERRLLAKGIAIPWEASEEFDNAEVQVNKQNSEEQ